MSHTSSYDRPVFNIHLIIVILYEFRYDLMRQKCRRTHNITVYRKGTWFRGITQMYAFGQSSPIFLMELALPHLTIFISFIHSAPSKAAKELSSLCSSSTISASSIFSSSNNIYPSHFYKRGDRGQRWLLKALQLMPNAYH